MSANNADKRHVQHAINLVEGHGDTVIRWHYSIKSNEFDVVIIISGEHNSKMIHACWGRYSPNEDLDISEVDTDDNDDHKVYLGRGLYGFIEDFNRSPIYLMLCPDLDKYRGSDSLDSYLSNEDDKGAAFIKFDSCDTELHDEDDYEKMHGYIDLEMITNTCCYKYHAMSGREGFRCKENQNIGSSSTSVASITNYIDTPSASTSVDEDLSLLLLRRVR